MPHNTRLSSSVTFVGHLHESLSRQNTREQISELDSAREGATDRSTYSSLTRQADSARGALAVRNAFTLLTVPLDAVFGTQRVRPEYADREVNCGSSAQMYAEHPCDVGAASWATAGAGLCVTVPAAVTGMVVGGALGTVVNHPAAGVRLGGAATTVPAVLAVTGFRLLFSEVTALPSAALKAVGSGIGGGAGWLYGLVHGPLAARRLASD